MAIDTKLLDILVCPERHGELELIDLRVHGRATVVERTRHRRGSSKQCKTDQEGTEQRQGPMVAG